MTEHRERQKVKDEENVKRFGRARTAMAAGVGFETGVGNGDRGFETLRVDANTCRCDHAALIGLLIRKGVIVRADYLRAAADEMEGEQSRYEERLQAHYGGKKEIKLGDPQETTTESQEVVPSTPGDQAPK
jgi:hypothetical protein